jgi:hypothetical protein
MRLASKLALAAPLLVCMLASSASAQGWMTDRSRREGPGFRVGNLELHPGLGIEAGYDTNVFYEDDNPEGSFLLRLTGHLDVSTLGEQRRTEGETTDSQSESGRKLDFRGGVAASYYHFFTNDARDNVGLDAYLAATINPEGRFSVYLHDEFSRTIRPFVDRGSMATGDRPTYARSRNTAGAEFRLQSRGGVLKGALGYDYNLDFFEDDQFDYVNSHQHTMRLRLAWRFLPQTSLISITEVHRQDYFRNSDAVSRVIDNWRVSSKIGVNGALTRTVAFTAMVGYAGGFYDAGDDFDNVEAAAQIKWQPRQTLNFALGYDRSFRPSFLGNFVKRDRIYLNGQLLAAGSFLLGLDLGLVFAETGVAQTPTGVELGNNAVRNDVFLTANLHSEYRFTDWLALTASVGYYGDYTDFDYDPAAVGGPIPDPGGGYQKFEAWLGLRAFY